MTTDSTTFTREESREIAGRAQTLFERRGSDNERVELPHVDPDEVLEDWDDKFDECALRDRLAVLGWDESTVRRLCHENKLPADEPLPEWIHTVNEVLEFVDTTPLPNESRFEEAAFGRFHSLLVRFARERLEDCVDHVTLAGGALTSSLQWLYRRLTSQFVRVLYVELKSFVATHDRELARADPSESSDRPTEYYEQFLTVLVEEDGLRDIFEAYPVFARLLAVRLDLWVDATVEVVTRVSEDRDRIDRTFGVSADAAISDIEPLADDTHAGGRTATKVTFGDGTRIVYSPRSIEPAVTFYDGLGTLDEHVETPAQYVPELLSMDGYGWREFVPHETCESETEIERYYRRAGVLLLWTSMTNTTDLQDENVLSHGEYPVLLDLETFMEPYVDPANRPFPFSGMEAIEDTSVFTTLPPWGVEDPGQIDVDLKKHGIAGFGSTTDPVVTTEHSTPRVVAPNSDVMSVEMTQPVLEGNTNVPQLDGRDQPPHEYVTEILEGFTAAYDALAELTEGGDSLRSLFEAVRIGGETNRAVLRPTKNYVDVIQSALARESLVDGSHLTVAVEELATPFHDGWVDDEKTRELYEYEREAILRLEPPRFESSVDDTVIRYRGQDTGMRARDSGLTRTREALDELGPSNRDRECQLISQLFEAVPGAGSAVPDDAPVYHESLRESAADVLDEIESMSVEMTTPASRPFYEYTSIEPNVGESGLTLKFAGESMATGLLGPALLAGALYRETGVDRYAEFVDELVEPIRGVLNRTERGFGVGGFHGTGALVYGFSLLAEFVDEDEYREVVSRVLTRFSPSVVDETDRRDLREGTAGLCAACLGTKRRVDDDRLDDVAVQSGRRLLEQTPVENPTHGFDRGDAGVAYVLARLGVESGDEKFSTCARRVFDELDRPTDSRHPKERNRQRGGIAHGPPGDVYARLVASDTTDSIFYEPEGVDLVRQYCTSVGEFDHLTTGNAGRIELATVASKLSCWDGPESHVERLRVPADNVVTVGDAAPLRNVSLLYGLSGVGYTCLRAVNHSFPSVYAFE